MKKSFLNTRRRSMLFASLLLVLTATMAIKSVSAAGLPYLYVYPTTPAVITQPGGNVTVEVKVNNVSACYGADFWLTYNSTLLQKVGLVNINGPFPSGNPPIRPDPVLYPGGYSFFDLSTAGIVKVSLTAVYAVVDPLGWKGFNGTGTVCSILFKGTTNTTLLPASSNLIFDETKAKIWTVLPGPPPTFVAVPRDPCVNGVIDVIPEFPAIIIAPLLITATLAAASLGKIVWSRKRRSPATH